MPRNLLTLGLFLLMGNVASAQGEAYTVHSGDTISAIAARLHVSQKAIVEANGLNDRHRLKLGQKLRIPSGHPSGHKSSVSEGGYTVRDGEVDWTIAHKHGLTVPQLHRLNPGVNWTAIQVGQRLNVGANHATSSATVAKAAPETRGTYKVREGDNDWTIASRLGVSAHHLRALNPSVDWDHIRIGASLNVPGVAKVASSGQIKSRTVAVKGENVVLRNEASTDGQRLATVDHGVRGTVLDKDGNWYRLRFASGRTGWMRSDFLRPATGSELAIREGFAQKATRVAEVVKPKVHKTIVAVKAKPKPKAPVRVAKAKPVAKPKVHKTIVAMAAPKPHVFSTRMVAMQTLASVSTVTSRAQNWRGVRYHYGAMSRSATDCSGFTSQVFRSVGVRLPRTSTDQASVGSSVGRGGLQAGDLVFFRTVRGRRIGHVGIYMGNGRFIHASSGGGKVMVSNLTEGYYRNRFVTARRVAGSKIHSQRVLVAAKAKHEGKPLPDILPDSVEDQEVVR